MLKQVDADQFYFKEETEVKRAEKKAEKGASETAAKVAREAAATARMAAKADAKAQEHALRVKANARKAATDQRNSNDIYCVCDGSEDGRPMVHCSYCDDWFHYDCVSFTKDETQRKGTRWYCPTCAAVFKN